ncbi:hypothetical protein BX616_007053 [Lobosporangium transversale]|uniref:Uncharacterized protein n=1 Tax=Lobosporangium transversale TaxID=64571 RepID=A0A1Y2GB05_9FUNG|nr:hypothetical protein BCR41DRAFT_361402 [Lobosporangium transversale]KAF9919329.1 hypothetical protein BX616_007053 [Lobosporangium transversale]ORZ05903.1 hypothetical protein BCR41DRAFT_361402 [Lobosporangium transversale]|eukprot:XP_021877284.1 hypothetical protein BCR41DRAFT_361402 [Lobosporangium transversale]
MMSNQKTRKLDEAHKECNSTIALQRSSSRWSSYLPAVVLGLLSSSCCTVQLVLNAFSIGCAGFSILTPFRPVFSVITLLLITYTTVKYRFSSRTFITLSIAILLTASPEMASIYNRAPSSALQLNLNSVLPDLTLWPPKLLFQKNNFHRHTLATQQETQGALTTNQASFNTPSKALLRYDVHIEGMACEACANRLRQKFISQPGIEHAKVFFDQKRLQFWTKYSPGALMYSAHEIEKMVSQVDNKYLARLIGTFTVEESEQ